MQIQHLPDGAIIKITSALNVPFRKILFNLRLQFILDPSAQRNHEALFLLRKEFVEIKNEDNGEKVSFQGLLRRFQSLDANAWVRYLIYRDLRSRGYVAREGFGLGIDFRVYERGEYRTKTAKHLIFGIQEGQPVSMEELARTLQYVQSLKKNLILAVINRRGEIVYYSLSQLTLE